MLILQFMKDGSNTLKKWWTSDCALFRSEGPLTGTVDYPLEESLLGFKSEDLNVWKVREGMSMDGSYVDNNHEYFDDENWLE